MYVCISIFHPTIFFSRFLTFISNIIIKLYFCIIVVVHLQHYTISAYSIDMFWYIIFIVRILNSGLKEYIKMVPIVLRS